MSSLTYLLRLFANVDLIVHLLLNQLTTTTNVSIFYSAKLEKHFTDFWDVSPSITSYDFVRLL